MPVNLEAAPARITGETKLEKVLELTIGAGVPAVPVLGPDNLPCGHFHLHAFLANAAAGFAWNTNDPVKNHLALEGGTPPSAMSPLATQLLLGGLAGEAGLLFGILDGAGKAVFLNPALRQAFPERGIVPTSLLAPTGPSRPSMGVMKVENHSYVMLSFPPGATGGLTFLLGLELTRLLETDHRELLEENDLLNRLLDACA
ncbi:MAG: hypothetical protein HGA66_13365, partial [Holophaga sp.]|nr:hypothetical protein [Holophaga sp.]